MTIPLLATEITRVTIQYSNALLVAVLPHVSDCCEKLQIPMPASISAQQVRVFRCPATESRPDNCCVVLTNDCKFTFQHGIMDTFHRHPIVS